MTAGDGCFYVGLGGKSTLPKQSSYEPYQCCPTKVTRGTKVAKMTPHQTPVSKPTFGKVRQSTNSQPTKPAPKPVVKSTPKLSTPKLPTPKLPTPVRLPAKPVREPIKTEKKGKKSFFGSGKYIWWW